MWEASSGCLCTEDSCIATWRRWLSMGGKGRIRNTTWHGHLHTRVLNLSGFTFSKDIQPAHCVGALVQEGLGQWKWCSEIKRRVIDRPAAKVTSSSSPSPGGSWGREEGGLRELCNTRQGVLPWRLPSTNRTWGELVMDGRDLTSYSPHAEVLL